MKASNTSATVRLSQPRVRVGRPRTVSPSSESEQFDRFFLASCFRALSSYAALAVRDPPDSPALVGVSHRFSFLRSLTLNSASKSLCKNRMRFLPPFSTQGNRRGVSNPTRCICKCWPCGPAGIQRPVLSSGTSSHFPIPSRAAACRTPGSSVTLTSGLAVGIRPFLFLPLIQLVQFQAAVAGLGDSALVANQLPARSSQGWVRGNVRIIPSHNSGSVTMRARFTGAWLL
jgi:hypothetical protein